MEKSYYLTKKDLTDVIEINFEELSRTYNNFIIEYTVSDNKYFRRTLFNLDRLNLNIGILITDITIDIKYVIENLINNIRGFNINLGLWINFKGSDSLYNIYTAFALYKYLDENFDKYFITGIRDMTNKTEISCPKWTNNGDISEYNTNEKYLTVDLISDYKTIYKENNMNPIPSNYKI